MKKRDHLVAFLWSEKRERSSCSLCDQKMRWDKEVKQGKLFHLICCTLQNVVYVICSKIKTISLAVTQNFWYWMTSNLTYTYTRYLIFVWKILTRKAVHRLWQWQTVCNFMHRFNWVLCQMSKKPKPSRCEETVFSGLCLHYKIYWDVIS